MFMSIKLALQKILEGIFHTEEEGKIIINMTGQERIKLKRGSDEPMRARKASNMINCKSEKPKAE
jgi:hypothetical protein